MHQVIAQAPQVKAPLECVIAQGLGPVGDAIDVGLASVPRLAGRVANDGDGKAALDVDPRQPAGKRVEVYALDAQSVRGLGAVVTLLGDIPVMADANPRFGDQCRRENVGMDERTTLLVLYAGALEAAALGTARQPKDRLVGDILYGAAEAEGIAIVLSVIEVELSIEGTLSCELIS